MYYADSTKGFYSIDINGDSAPSDAVEITNEYHVALLAGQSEGMVIAADASGYPVLEKSPAQPPYIPAVVTMRQARLALHAAGLLQSVEDAIEAMPEPERTEARIEWDYASEVRRDSVFTASIGAAIGLDGTPLNDLFTYAAQL